MFETFLPFSFFLREKHPISCDFPTIMSCPPYDCLYCPPPASVIAWAYITGGYETLPSGFLPHMILQVTYYIVGQ